MKLKQALIDPSRGIAAALGDDLEGRQDRLGVRHGLAGAGRAGVTHADWRTHWPPLSPALWPSSRISGS